MNKEIASLLNEAEGFLGQVFYWTSMPKVFWQVQGIVHVERSGPKILATNIRMPSQQAHIPVGLFLDSISYKLLKVYDYEVMSKVFASISSASIYDCVVDRSMRA